MPTAAEVHASIKTTLESGLPAVDFRFKNSEIDLPDTPATHVYVDPVFNVPDFVSFGGGRGLNRQRTTGQIEAHVMVPAGSGSEEADELAEDICALFRGQKIDDVSYFAAQAIPMNGKTEDGAYAHIATAVVSLQFDQLG